MEAGDIRAAGAVLHLLSGISGNIGAKALHLYVKQIYPRVLDGQWPIETEWFDRTTALGNRSADALHQCFVAAISPVDQTGVSSED
ncbi:hypothetical protein ACLKMY_40295 [Paraburkholderia mimosarum]|uniref:hypothetical protein n=1 Tax=Paraburkholderia mimosarum TaxID=312026 RepID=UPI0004184CAC|nr:hypothetical protein [Paraburkholderia mimosarum]